MKRLIVLLVLIPIVQALEMPEIGQIKDDYNNNIDKIPKFVKRLIGTERINCYIETEEGEITFYAMTKKGMIEELEEGELDDPTLIVRTSDATIEAIMEAEDPVARLKKAMKDKELTYEAQSFGKKLKWGFNRMLMGIGGFFVGLFK
jgi:hypothetical protein